MLYYINLYSALEFLMKYLLAAMLLVCNLVNAQTVTSTKTTYRTDSVVLNTGTPVVNVSTNSDSLTSTQSDGSVIKNVYSLVQTTTTIPTTSRDLKYEITTTYLSDGTKTVAEKLISDSVVTANKSTTSTQRNLIDTVLISGAPGAVVTNSPTFATTSKAQTASTDYNPLSYSASWYYGFNPNMGKPTPVFSNDPRAWLTSETYNRSNEIINANYAWARGWTGKGSTILIMDTGIDLRSTDFAGKIKYQLDLTGTGVQDQVGHGSNVAGIAAGARNGVGINGVAFDADLAIAKITNNKSITSGNAIKALAWGSQYNDIVVANYSGNTSYSTAYTKSVTNIAPGVFASSDKNYGGKNYYNLETPQQWAAVLPSRMVLTVSAGNSTNPYPQNPATFAAATDASGKLVLNGQMLIVGNWNDQAGRVEGAQAGHICKNVVGTTCNDLYKTSDFYILAPGMSVNSVSPTSVSSTGYKALSGSSQAAPAVAGAVAVISQLWPYMSANDKVQLLLKTANKNLPGYNVNTMGQGLLDLNRATQPVGNLGISTSGRTGQSVPISGGIALSAPATTAKATLSSVSVVDDFKRDFTVDLSGAVGKNQLMANPITMDADPGSNWSGRWTGLVANATQILPIHGGQNNGDSTVTVDSRVFNPKATVSHQFTFTNSKYNPYVNFAGSWGETKTSSTMEYSTVYREGKQGWWGQVGVMSTNIDYKSGLVDRVTPIVAMHGSGGYQAGDWNLYAGIKPTVVYGFVNMNVPTSVDADGNMSYTNAKTNLAGVGPVPYVGVKWSHNFEKNSSLFVRASVAQDSSSNMRLMYVTTF